MKLDTLYKIIDLIFKYHNMNIPIPKTKRQITEDELRNILELLYSSDNEIKILGVSLLNCYDWTGLKETQNHLF